MVPSDVTVDLEFFLLFVTYVDAQHLRGVESVLSGSEASAAATAREPLVVGVIGITETHHLNVVLHHSHHEAFCIAVFRSCRHISIHHESFVHSALYAEVEHRFFLAVVNTRHSRHIALLVVCLDALYYACRQIFHCRLGVAGHKLLTVNENFLYLLTVDGYLSAFVNCCSREFLHEFFYHRALRCSVGVGIIYEGVFAQYHLLCLCCHRRCLQHYGVGTHHECSEVYGLSSFHADVLAVRLVAHATQLYYVSSVVNVVYTECSAFVGQSTLHEGAVATQQLHSNLFYSLFRISVCHRSADTHLSLHSDTCRQEYQRHK